MEPMLFVYCYFLESRIQNVGDADIIYCNSNEYQRFEKSFILPTTQAARCR